MFSFPYLQSKMNAKFKTRCSSLEGYDPVIKPWMSSYHAFSNNPIAKIDQNGANDDWVEGADGYITWRDDVIVTHDENQLIVFPNPTTGMILL
jgi:hypothetical protein